MITRQIYCKTLRKFSKQRSFTSENLHTYNNAYQLLDKNSQPNSVSIHRSMLDSIHKNLPFQALKIFKKNIQFDFFNSIDEVTIALALKSCCGDKLLGSQIHGFAITSGLYSFITVPNSLMNMYCKSGQFTHALCIFETLNDPDIVSWNTVLSGFQRSEEALNFALKMNSNGVVFDAVTYTTVLAFCSRIEEFLFGLQLHSCILKVGLDCEVFVGNALITMYSRWGCLLEAGRVFEEMQTTDLVSWNAIISGYTQAGIYGLEAISIFIEMVRRGIKLDHVSFTSAISACGHERNLEVGRQVHGLSIKRGYGKHVSVGNVLISTYSKCEIIEDAKLVFQNMLERNVVSWTTMISIDEENAVSFFNEMRYDEVDPNDVTFVGLIHAITIGDLVESGKTVHGFCIKSGFSLEPSVQNSFITMYAKFGSAEDSMKVFEELNYREIITWNALISGYAQNGLSQEAIITFFSALAESKPNQYTFGSVLSAIGAAEDISLKHGQMCHAQIMKLGFNSDPVVSSALLDMYAKRGSICESQRVFAEAPQRSQFAWTAIISAYARHGDYESVMNWLKKMEEYACMVDMLGRAGRLKEAEELVSCIPGGPGLSVLQSLLGACRIHGNVEMGERVADALISMEPTESGSYVLMSNLYAEKGQWKDVAKVRKGMREKGVKKEVGFSWVDVGDIDASLTLHAFSSGDKSHPQSEEICRIADCLGSEMKFLRDSLVKDGDFKAPQEGSSNFVLIDFEM
eukprot:XP_025014088.1 pentatricopeptide repeat-containing protein At4g32430, mitochondrial [Ricinus communis]